MKKIYFFGVENAFYLNDNYTSDNFFIESLGVKYPSVRHAVISFKTRSSELRENISKILMPADLKDYELSIKSPNYWKPEFVLNIFKSLTLRKFEENPEFAKKLIETHDKFLEKNSNIYEIEELRNIRNYDGIILTEIRNYLKKQKAP